MSARTFTVRDEERVPVDRRARMVVSPGPKWCAPEATEKAPEIELTPIRAGKPKNPGAKRLYDRLNEEQKAVYNAFFPSGVHSSLAMRNGLMRQLLGMSMKPHQRAAFDQHRANAIETEVEPSTLRVRCGDGFIRVVKRKELR